MRPIPTVVDMEMFARTVWGEARTESEEGQIAVAWVIKNRARQAAQYRASKGEDHPVFGNGSLAAVCKAARQFAVWSADGPMHNLAGQVGFDDREFCRSFAIVCRVWNGDYPDPSDGATYYHPHDLDPDWAQELTPTALIGRHIFYAE